ncbi:MAG: hypothetical protein VKN56_10360, partial [Cyanobacteriota bacterium]|nr:hypothetical protein [Cyanobacteriota bacterium]
EHTNFSPSLWDWDADGVRGTASRMEQLCVHALLVQLDAPHLVAAGEVPPPPGAKGFGGRAALGYRATEESLRRPVWLGKDYQLQRQAGGAQRGFWRALSPLAGPVAAPLEWVEPVVGWGSQRTRRPSWQRPRQCPDWAEPACTQELAALEASITLRFCMLIWRSPLYFRFTGEKPQCA